MGSALYYILGTQRHPCFFLLKKSCNAISGIEFNEYTSKNQLNVAFYCLSTLYSNIVYLRKCYIDWFGDDSTQLGITFRNYIVMLHYALVVKMEVRH